MPGIAGIYARQERGQFVRQNAQRAECAIDMKVKIVGICDVSQGAEIIDCTRIDRSGRADDHEWPVSIYPVLDNLILQETQVHSAVRIDGNASKKIGSHARHLDCTRNAAMNFRRCVGDKARLLRHALRACGRAQRLRLRKQDGDKICLRRPGQE
jgi:hypothetical protein